jgi:hypothetical protein
MATRPKRAVLLTRYRFVFHSSAEAAPLSAKRRRRDQDDRPQPPSADLASLVARVPATAALLNAATARRESL